jgi:hypothetical protein
MPNRSGAIDELSMIGKHHDYARAQGDHEGNRRETRGSPNGSFSHLSLIRASSHL